MPMKKTRFKIFSLLIILSILLSSCGKSAIESISGNENNSSAMSSREESLDGSEPFVNAPGTPLSKKHMLYPMYSDGHKSRFITGPCQYWAYGYDMVRYIDENFKTVIPSFIGFGDQILDYDGNSMGLCYKDYKQGCRYYNYETREDYLLPNTGPKSDFYGQYGFLKVSNYDEKTEKDKEYFFDLIGKRILSEDFDDAGAVNDDLFYLKKSDKYQMYDRKLNKIGNPVAELPYEEKKPAPSEYEIKVGNGAQWLANKKGEPVTDTFSYISYEEKTKTYSFSDNYQNKFKDAALRDSGIEKKEEKLNNLGINYYYSIWNYNTDTEKAYKRNKYKDENKDICFIIEGEENNLFVNGKKKALPMALKADYKDMKDAFVGYEVYRLNNDYFQTCSYISGEIDVVYNDGVYNSLVWMIEYKILNSKGNIVMDNIKDMVDLENGLHWVKQGNYVGIVDENFNWLYRELYYGAD